MSATWRCVFGLVDRPNATYMSGLVPLELRDRLGCNFKIVEGVRQSRPPDVLPACDWSYGPNPAM